MTKTTFTQLLFVAGALLAGAVTAPAQNFGFGNQMAGRWSGTRSERNPVTGLPFTVNFEFQFNPDGSYTERAGFGRATILVVEGQYTLQPGHKPGDPSVTHILTLQPLSLVQQPSQTDLNSMNVADLPNVTATSQYVFFYNLAPAGAATLQDVRPGAETWGLRREE